MKRLYTIIILLAGILIFGVAGSVDHDLISFADAVLIVVCAVVLGAAGFFGIMLEDARDAKKGRYKR